MRRFFSILAVVVALGLIAIPVFAQENKEGAPKSQEAQNPPEATVAPAPVQATTENTMQPTQPEEVSIYGEVKSLDAAANSVKLQYYDYDNDEEKTADLILDKDTKMENAAALHDIKQGDWIDAVYLVKGGKNIAKSVIVEKEEEETPAKPEENKTEAKPAKMSETE